MYGILCFGDCFVVGRGENPAIGWVGRLKYDFETDMYRNVHALGIAGDTIEGVLYRFNVEAKSRVRYLREKDEFKVIIQVGINDSKGNGSSDKYMNLRKFKSKLNKLIKQAKKFVKNNEICILGIPPVDESLTTPYEGTYMYNQRNQFFNKGMEEIAYKQQVHYIDIFTQLNYHDYLNTLVDGLHPNSKGYQMIYDIIKKKLVQQQILK